MFAVHVFQHGHLLDCYLVEFMQAFLLGHTFVDENRVEVLHIAQANQLVDCCVVADIAFVLGMCVAPLLGCHAEQSHIEYIRFVGIDKRAMVGVNLLRDKMLLDSVRMNMVVDLCQLAFSRPSKCFLLLFLELLIIADDIEFECRTYPWQTQRQYPYVHMSRHSALPLPVCR